MNNCKNCGSTAQFKMVYSNHMLDSIIEVYECQGCGYTENVQYTLECVQGRTAEGIIIYSRGRYVNDL